MPALEYGTVPCSTGFNSVCFYDTRNRPLFYKFYISYLIKYQVTILSADFAPFFSTKIAPLFLLPYIFLLTIRKVLQKTVKYL